MRKKTAPQIRKNREASPRKPSGLIAQDLSAQQSATLDCVLDNRSHRTSNYNASPARARSPILLFDLRHRENAARAPRRQCDAVEYRVEQHPTILRQRLAALSTTLFLRGHVNSLPRHSFQKWAQAH